MNIYSPQSDVFESLKTFDFNQNQLEVDGQLIPLFIDSPWNKGLTGYTRETNDIESWKNNISKSRKGQSSGFKNKQHSKESKEKNRQAHIGKKLSEKQKIEIGIFHKGRKRPESTKEKISKALKGKPSQLKGVERSDDIKKKISESKRGKKRVYREDGSFYMA